jgi:integrase
MARRLTGSIRQVDGRFEASVPEQRGARRRRYEYFATNEEAARWCAAAVNALYADLPIPCGADFAAAESTPREPAAGEPASGESVRGGSVHFFTRESAEWFDEAYNLLRRSGADRAGRVQDSLRLHIDPFFTTAISRPDQFNRDLVIRWLLRLTGSLRATYTVDEAAEIADRSVDNLRQLIGDRKLKVSTDGATNAELICLCDLEDAMGVERYQLGYSEATVSGLLDTLRRIEDRMVTRGVIPHTVSDDLLVPEVDPNARRRGKRIKRTSVTFTEVACVASQLHIVHQLVLWLLRVCGLRISEAYGILVGDIIDIGDDSGAALIAVERQGGRVFVDYDDNGHVVQRDSKEELKTDGSVRILMAPPVLMDLVRLVIRVFHTDPLTQQSDPEARLIPGISARNKAGQAGFRSAIRTVLGAEGCDIDSFVAHDMRASLVTDLSYTDIDLIRRRGFLGHQKGSDVHHSYIRDTRDDEKFRVIAEELQQKISDEIGTLIVPTSKFPNFGRSNDLFERRDHLKDLLIDAGSLREPLRDGDPLLAVNDAALELGCSLTTAHRRIRDGHLHADDSTGRQRIALSDVETHLQSRMPNLQEVAERTGVDYHPLYHLIPRLGLCVERDPITGDFMIDPAAEAALLGEFERVRSLHERARTTIEISRILRKSPSTVRLMLRNGQLAVESETDATGARFVSLAEIEAYQQRHANP